MTKSKFRILIIAYQFPPYSNVGSLRIGKFAKYLATNGHIVRVLCADNILMPASLDIEIDPLSIYRTKWFDVNFLPELFFGGRKQIITSGYKTKSNILKSMGFFYRLLTNFPDERIGWFPYAIHAGNKIIANEKFDFIYASSPTPTALIIANILSKKWGIPWIAEFRDPWADSDHYDFPEFRRLIEKKLEKKILANVSGIVSVSEPLAEYYGKHFHKPSISAMNGFSPEDIIDIKREINYEKDLILTYTGTVHLDIEHLEPLFDGVSRLGPFKQQIKILFYTRYIDGIMNLAKQFGVEKQIFHKDRVTYKESLQIQRNSDVLLFLIPHQYGNLTTKIFEYIAALRPILAIGNSDTLAAEFVKSRRVGITSDNPDKIASCLRKWIKQKELLNGIPDFSINKRRGLTRDEQYANILNFLNSFAP